MAVNSQRTEFGLPRTACACEGCRRNCHFMPGMLIPADLDRIIPPTVANVYQWAEANLLASPGALVRVRATGEIRRVPTLVPATKSDGSCIHLGADERCGIHAVAPFGCAFFDCGPERNNISHNGIMAIMDAHDSRALYHKLWHFLWDLGRRQIPPEIARARMEAACPSR